MSARPVVVYVHGLWMLGAEALLLRRHFQREHGWPLHVFHYRSVSQALPEVLAALERCVQSLDAPAVHLLGHSLGGAVILRYFQHYTMRQPGRVVFLGSPVLGSRSAQSFARAPLGSRMLGRMAGELLRAAARRWTGPRELGVIAGTRPYGMGRLLQPFDEPSDGTVAFSETQLPGARDYLALNVTHLEMLWSAPVARAAAHFFVHGSFPPPRSR